MDRVERGRIKEEKRRGNEYTFKIFPGYKCKLRRKKERKKMFVV